MNLLNSTVALHCREKCCWKGRVRGTDMFVFSGCFLRFSRQLLVTVWFLSLFLKVNAACRWSCMPGRATGEWVASGQEV